MLQHNPFSHSIPCAALAVTLDGFEARELAPADAGACASCGGCQCHLIDDTKVVDEVVETVEPAQSGE